MSIHFSESDLLNIAITIEHRGIAFYEVMAKTTENEVVNHTLQHLANMEREHIQTFQKMLDELGESPPAETASPEYQEYVQALVDSAVFTDDLIASEMAAQADTVLKILELAISAEKDSVLFYYEMRGILPARVEVINRVITEEKSHLWKLSKLKKELEG
ncbi:ferritin family protein [Chloroflexota bacterium]